MSIQELFIIFLIATSMIIIISERLRSDVIALILLITLAFTNIVTPVQAISGFSRSAVITILGLFFISAGLERTGVTTIIADRILRIGGKSEVKLTLLFMSVGATLSLFMNNIAAGAVILPAALNASRRSGIAPSKLLIPVSFGTLLGGMVTFFTTANIVVSATLKDQNQQPFGLLSFAPVGSVVLVAGFAYIMFIGRRYLPAHVRQAENGNPIRTSTEAIDQFYQLNDRLWDVTILPDSELIGKTIAESQIGADLGLTVLAIFHGKQSRLVPSADERLREGDVLLLVGREDRCVGLIPKGVQLDRGTIRQQDLQERGVALVEMVITPHSAAEGKSLKELNFRQKYSMTGVAIWRDGRSYRTDVGSYSLKFGDALLLVGPPDRVAVLRGDPDFLLLEPEQDIPRPPARKALTAALITALVIILGVFLDIAYIPIVMLLGATLMVLTGCLTMDESYRAVEWRAVFLIACMLPLSIAMTQTGLAAHLAQGVILLFGRFGSLAVVGGLYLLAVMLCQIMSGQVTALVVAPVAISAALQLGINPQAACLAVALGCSTCFLTPMSHPVNVMMMGPGGYRVSDFFKIGAGMTVVSFVAVLLGLKVFWGL